MATQAPNPRDFRSSDDAFQYPVPVVRRLEQQLRGNINENRDKLRTLVGTSYRDLLSTAERIIEMDQQMHKAESLLGDIGQKCNARAIERIARNHARTVKSQRERNDRRNGLASTLSLLQQCMTIGGRIIKTGGSSLLVAKLLVLARLLQSSASKSPDSPPLLDTLKTRLASLRRRLLNYINKTLADSQVERNVLIEALSAFSLATTSTPTDVLRHFLNTRAKALTELLEEPSEPGVHSAMTLLLSTLKDAQTVFPKRLADLLARLQDEPLLQDEVVRGTPELNLDIYEQWIGEDVRNFTPYLRHDQLQVSQAAKVIQSWAKSAKKTLVEGLTKLLDGMNDAQSLTALRREVILKCLFADRKLPGIEQASFFEDLRQSFMTGLHRIANEKAQDLTTVANKFLNEEPLDDTTHTQISLWDLSSTEFDLSKGAVEFRSLIVTSNQGKDARLQMLDKSLTEWSVGMSALSATMKIMKEDRWDDDLDLDLDDELELSAPQDLLTKEDLQSLRETLQEAKTKALSDVYLQIQSSISKESDNSTAAPFLLRLLREILKHSSSDEAPTGASNKPPDSLLNTLYTRLAQQVIEESSAYRKYVEHVDFSRPPVTTLWEGNPILPVQPSITCFRLLTKTSKTMKDVGSDLWTHSAVQTLKRSLRDLVSESVESTVLRPDLKDKTLRQGSTDMEGGSTDDTEESERDLKRSQILLQGLYDIFYLEMVLGLAQAQEAESMGQVTAKLIDGVGLEDSALERLRKSSSDYYKRTYLLFGLFAV